MSHCRLLYCNCAYAQVLPPQVKADVLEQLTSSGVAFDAVADICEMSARKDPALKRLASSGERLKIAACYPRAVKWLFFAGGAPLPEEGVEVLNMRTQKADEVVEGMLGRDDGESAPLEPPEEGSELARSEGS